MRERAITGELIEQLQMSLEDAKALDIIVSFIQYSGFAMIQELLQEALRKKLPIRVLTSTYMNITDPTALFLLFEELGPGKVMVIMCLLQDPTLIFSITSTDLLVK